MEKGIKIDDLTADELKAIVESNAVQKFWSINKDCIKVCQDCEFRYMCLDKRVPEYISESEGYYHKSCCGYNPYFGKWIGEEGYIPAVFNDK